MRGALIASLALASGFQYAGAHPLSQTSKSHLTKRVVDLTAFKFKVAANYTDSTSVENRDSIRSNSPEDTATELVKRTVPDAKFRLVESYTGTNGVAHFYFKQTANDLDIDNADFNVNIGRDGQVLSFGNSFYTGEIPSPPSLGRRDEVDPAEALKGAVSTLQLPVQADQATSEPKEGKETFAIKNTQGAVSEPEAKLLYIQKEDGSLALTWRVETDIWRQWLLSYVDASSPETVHVVVDYSADATYEVYPWGLSNPTEGERIIVTDPANEQVSEFGWHGTGSEDYISTRGNNGIAHLNWDGSDEYENKPRPESPDLNFEYSYTTEESDFRSYGNASVTQLFYTANTYHDLLYLLGFTEAAGNFEFNNNGAGGAGSDFVILNAQDGLGKNNAFFLTPPDGTPGRMWMLMWDLTTPERDSSFDESVIIHEYTHGVSNRLTGGPGNSNCLNLAEAGGMGEGWGDFMATAIRLKPDDTRETDYPLGEWVSGDARGIRAFLYSTSMTTNPYTYSSNDDFNTRVHSMGTVWATMLYELLWNLIDKHGKNDGPVPEFDGNGVPTDGKYLTLKLVVDGMALQPCNPTFVAARDAILDADRALTGGENACEIWTAFAKRGLGEGAVYDNRARTDSFVVPEGAC